MVSVGAEAHVAYSVYHVPDTDSKLQQLEIVERLTAEERYIIQLSDGTRSLRDIFNEFPKKHPRMSENGFNNICTRLYSMQHIY